MSRQPRQAAHTKRPIGMTASFGVACIITSRSLVGKKRAVAPPSIKMLYARAAMCFVLVGLNGATAAAEAEAEPDRATMLAEVAAEDAVGLSISCSDASNFSLRKVAFLPAAMRQGASTRGGGSLIPIPISRVLTVY